MGTRASAQVMCAGKGRMIRVRVRMIQEKVRMTRLHGEASVVMGAVIRMIRGEVRMIRLGPDDPDGRPA